MHRRESPLNLSPEEFRRLGHRLVDEISAFFAALPEQALTRAESPDTVRELIGQGGLPEAGTPADELLAEASQLVFGHGLHNGHPAFLGYITSSAAPLGALADLLAAAANANVGKWDLSPVASEIEAQTIRWLAEFIGYPTDCGGIMVSGGNMANMLGFFAARRSRADWDIRAAGLKPEPRQLTIYASRETHTWVEKAADISGLGTDAIRWVATNALQQIELDALEAQLAADLNENCRPFLLIGTAGNVSTGAIDPLPELGAVARRRGLWFHVDGAYGAPAAALADAPQALQGLASADSIALDPHKWLYAPLEAATTLVRNPQALRDAFSYQPPYYSFDEADPDPGNNYYELGLQNSRGFRALKVWLALRQVGRAGYVQMIADDVELAKYLFHKAQQHPQLEAVTQNLSITTFRFVPPGAGPGDAAQTESLNQLNQQLLLRLQKSGTAFVSNAIVDGQYLLRACVVNFRTTEADMDALVELVTELGTKLVSDTNF